jgi:SAM-dependent methyltransferase
MAPMSLPPAVPLRPFSAEGRPPRGSLGLVARVERSGIEKTRRLERRQLGLTEGYDLWAGFYDTYDNPLVLVEERPVRELLGDVRGHSVLDAGCGTGRHTRWLCDQGARVLGVDASLEMVRVARAKCPEADLLVGSVLDLPVEAGSFDTVLNALMAEHVPDLAALMVSLARALRRGGRLVLSVFHPAMVQKGVLTHFEHAESGAEYELVTCPHRVEDYWAALTAAGLEVETTMDVGLDEALLERMPWMCKHTGVPLALLLRGRKA